MQKRTSVRTGLAITFAAIVATISLTDASAGSPLPEAVVPLTVAVVGDIPYGEAQQARFGELIAAINKEPRVRMATHLGDIRSGSTACTDERFAAVAEDFATFEDPLVYTPGDNERAEAPLLRRWQSGLG